MNLVAIPYSSSDRELIANTIELMLVGDHYDGSFMCTAVENAQRFGRITKEACDLTLAYFMHVTNGDQSLLRHFRNLNPDDTYLEQVATESREIARRMERYNRGLGDWPYLTDAEEGILFERRIVISNVYWSLVRHLRTTTK